jgi:peptide/nickel transport system substrate-binding protein
MAWLPKLVSFIWVWVFVFLPFGALSFSQPTRGGTVVISFGVGTPKHFNPAVQSGSATAIVGTQIFASPLRYDDRWNPRPYLAREWKISDDSRSVTLRLVEGALFHDGRPVTSQDVAFSVMAVKEHHPFKSMFAPVERVDTPDPQTAVIRLSRPHPAILLAMSPALLPILPKHVYGDGQDLMTHPANLAPVGSGPFKLTEYVQGKKIVLRRHPAYFIPGLPYLDELIFRLEPDPSVQMVDMERQEAHIIPLFIDFPGLDRLSQEKHLVATPKGYEALGPINWLAFNLLRKPLDDKRVRQAIAYAMDPEFIIEHLHRGRSRRAPGPIAPDSPFFSPRLHVYPLDLERAQRLLDEAGYPRKSDGTRFSVTLDYIPVVPSQFRDVALYLRRQLEKVGIRVQVQKSETFPEWAKRIGDWDFDMTMDASFNWGDPVIGVHRAYQADNIRKGVVWSNTQNYRNEKVDAIFQQASQEMDGTKRKALYDEFQQIVTDELPVIWINVYPFHTVYHAGLGNPPLSIWGVHSPFDELKWEKPIDRRWIPVPRLEVGDPPLKRIGVRAMEVLQSRSIYEALELLGDPNEGFFDHAVSGFHLVGFTRKGFVFLDNSNQMKPGMDMKGVLDLEGNPIFPRLLDAADGKSGGMVHSRKLWPHPATKEVRPMSGWCGKVTQGDLLCALGWE